MEVSERFLMYKGLPVFGRVTKPNFNREAKEYATEEACFIFVNEGRLSIRAQDQLLEIDQQQGLLAKCINFFYEVSRKQRQLGDGVDVIGVLLHPSIMEELFEADFSLPAFRVNFNLKQVQIDALLDAFRQSIAILIDNPELADEAMLRNKLKEFVLLLAKRSNAPSSIDFLAAMFKPNHVEFKTVVQSNLYSSLSVDELAKLCHMSTSSFKRKFKEVYGESPKTYIALKKIEKASNLLQIKSNRVSDVAYDVGFETVSTFNRSFKSVVGKSPTEYRLAQTA
ncbi:MAG: helix-turn-helix transcriptional regulator [Flavobacteriales bacterium]|nr:helix-turn-helix transcriptional regulator [Flavobacteriales bacterium]